MEENKKLSTAEEFARSTNAYQAAINLHRLSSEQVHSRLSAMLTSNTIIIAVSGLAVTSQISISTGLIAALITGGLILCLVWGVFVYIGLQTELYYRRKIEEFEPGATPAGAKLVIHTNNWRSWGFGIATYFTVAVFVAIYATLFFILMEGG